MFSRATKCLEYFWKLVNVHIINTLPCLINLAQWFVVAFDVVRMSIAWFDPGIISWLIRMLMHHVLLVRRWSAVFNPKLYNALGKVVVLINEVIF